MHQHPKVQLVAFNEINRSEQVEQYDDGTPSKKLH